MADSGEMLIADNCYRHTKHAVFSLMLSHICKMKENSCFIRSHVEIRQTALLNWITTALSFITKNIPVNIYINPITLAPVLNTLFSLLDIIFLQGTEVIFKVALSLLSSQETSIMGCESFENIVDFLKTTIPDMTKPQMEKIITQVRMFFSLLFPPIFSLLEKDHAYTICKSHLRRRYVKLLEK